VSTRHLTTLLKIKGIFDEQLRNENKNGVQLI